MRYLVILSFIAVLFTPYVFAEESFDGSSSIDPLITEVTPKKPTIMNVKFQYTSGPYAMNNFIPIIEISPDRAGKFVQIDVEPIEIQKGQIRRIPVSLTVDPGIEHEKIFLSISFIGNHFQTSEPYKSSWNESLTLDIAPRDEVGIALGDCELVNINYEISGGDVFTACKKQDEISFKAIIDANSEGIVTFDIPTNIVYGLSSKDCKLDNTFFVLMDGKEIAAHIVGKKDSNLVTVEFTTGIHEIEVIGFTIIPSPSPAQYCGIVMDYDSQFLPPKQQTNRGVELRFIQCNNDYQLVVKHDGSPACVKPQTKSKLLQRGWSEPEKQTIFSKQQEGKELNPAIQKAKELGISNIMNAVDSKDLSYDEKLEYIKIRYEENGPVIQPSLNLRIQNLAPELEFGEQITFTLIENGYANPCTSPKLDVYLIEGHRGLYSFEENKPIYERQLVYSCPKFEGFFPILNYWSEKDFSDFPSCMHEGVHVIVGDSGTERHPLAEYYCNSPKV